MENTKEERILDAAMDEFTEKGWSGARMQSIADRADINKPLLHYYFRSKENLYKRIMEKILKVIISRIQYLVKEEQSFEVFLKHFIATLIDSAAANPRLPLFLMQELSRRGKTAKEVIKDALQKEQEFVPAQIAQRFQKEMEEGHIRKMALPQLIITIVGACLYYFMAEPILMDFSDLPFFGMEKFDRNEFLEERKKAVFTLVYYGIKEDKNENSL